MVGRHFMFREVIKDDREEENSALVKVDKRSVEEFKPLVLLNKFDTQLVLWRQERTSYNINTILNWTELNNYLLI